MHIFVSEYLEMITDKENFAIAIKLKVVSWLSIRIFIFDCKCQGQDQVYFDSGYRRNGDR